MRPLFFCVFISLLITAQSIGQVQNVRGQVVDDISQAPLPGAVVMLISLDPQRHVSTDVDGYFNMQPVPLGRHELKIKMMGYEEATMSNVLVTAGKEVVLMIRLTETIVTTAEVNIQANERKEESVNTMTGVSTRAFSVEETQKFAAAINDPGRMAMSYAGVVGGSDGSNLISIRGNAPNGLLWRMEGADIPNPNHFASSASSGGGISILSAQLLDNSDFSTGAFSAEYGNALSGVFDLKLRKGNNQKREVTLQAGFLGLDAAVEGPVGNGGSYLINYRYSTLTLLGKLGVPIGDELTNFQDFAYNIFLPTNGKSSYEFYGFSGRSSSLSAAEKDSAKWENDWQRLDGKFYSNSGAYGVKHILSINEKAYVQSTLLYSQTYNAYKEDRLNDELKAIPQYENADRNGRVMLSSVFNYKWNAKHSGRFGGYVNAFAYDTRELLIDSVSDELKYSINARGNTYTWQAFAQMKYRASNKTTILYGAHALALALNRSWSVEPRVSIRQKINQSSTVSMGYGLHSQIQPMGMYFAQDPLTGKRINQSLKLSKSHHFVIAYDRLLNEFLHVKMEAYYQHLFDIPMAVNASSSLAAFNVVENYITEEMANTGIGRNKGIEVTLEQFTHRDMYFLLSLSLYDAKYKATDGVWRNTRFNANSSASFTAGKEMDWNRRGKNRVVGFNLRVLFNDGMRTTPIDAVASAQQQSTVVHEDQLFTTKAKEYFRIDTRVSVRRNYAKATTTLALDIQNTSNHKNEQGRYYDPTTQKVEVAYQVPLIPVLSYKVEF